MKPRSSWTRKTRTLISAGAWPGWPPPPGFGGDLDGAIEDFEAALVKPCPETYFHLGEAYKKKGLNDNAKEAYQKALALNPEYAAAKKALEEFR